MQLLDRTLTDVELKYYEEKPYDFCHICKQLSMTCEGPNLLAMDMDRLVEWCSTRADRLGLSHRAIADLSNIPKSTIDNFFAGRTDSVKISTLREIVKVLIGGCWGHPCHHAQRILKGGEPEVDLAREVNQLRKSLKDAQDEILRLQKFSEGLEDKYMAEVRDMRHEYIERENAMRTDAQRREELLREDARVRIDYIKAESERKDKIIEKLMD